MDDVKWYSSAILCNRPLFLRFARKFKNKLHIQIDTEVKCIFKSFITLALAFKYYANVILKINPSEFIADSYAARRNYYTLRKEVHN